MSAAEISSVGDPSQDVTRLSILGTTGSIGCSAIDVIQHQPERFDIVALVGNKNIELLAKQAKAVGAEIAVTADENLYQDLRDALSGSDVEVAAGAGAVLEAAQRPVDMNLAAIVGAAGLEPTLAAAEQGATIALANKECLVCAGDVFKAALAASGSRLLPVDSEHSAVFQVFENAQVDQVEKIILTASGGPFRTVTREEMESVTPEQALDHPNWDMGPKITIDSATLMNKGLELIEAYHLFPVGHDQLDAVIHPQSIVHSMVSYTDGSVLAQMGVPDMKTPIAYALAWPNRMPTQVDRLDLVQIGQLTFEEVDREKFPSIDLCLGCLERGGSASAIMNASNEIAVAEFLAGNMPFLGITELSMAVVNEAESAGMVAPMSSLEDVAAADEYGRREATRLARSLHS